MTISKTDSSQHRPNKIYLFHVSNPRILQVHVGSSDGPWRFPGVATSFKVCYYCKNFGKNYKMPLFLECTFSKFVGRSPCFGKNSPI